MPPFLESVARSFAPNFDDLDAVVEPVAPPDDPEMYTLSRCLITEVRFLRWLIAALCILTLIKLWW
jgi:hypothetical protein